MRTFFDEGDRKALEENKRRAEKWRMVFTHPDAFDVLVTILQILKWRGKLKTEEDVARHNAAEEIMAQFGMTKEGQWLSMESFEDQVRAAMKG